MRLSIATVLTLVINAILTLPAYSAEWGFGIGHIHLGSEYDGVDSQKYILPFPQYRGERLTVDLDGLSYSLIQAEPFQLSALIRGRFDGFDLGDSQLLADLEERKPGVDGGMSITSTQAWGVTELTLLADISGTSDGYELTLSYQYPFNIGRWLIAPKFGIKAGSQELVDYYYGVDTGEVVSGRPAYAADWGTDIYLTMAIGYHLTTKSSLLLGVEHTRQGSAKTDSPIVKDSHRTNVIAFYIYRF